MLMPVHANNSITELTVYTNVATIANELWVNYNIQMLDSFKIIIGLCYIKGKSISDKHDLKLE